MFKLHHDSFAKREGFCTTEEYMISRFSGFEDVRFEDVETFLSLRDEGLIDEDSYIRTSDDRNVDRCYVIGSGGEFFGLHFDAYPLEARIYELKEVFESQKISDGFVLCGRLFELNFLKWVEKNLNKK